MKEKSKKFDVFDGHNCFQNQNIVRGLRRAKDRLEKSKWYLKDHPSAIPLPKKSLDFFTTFLRGADTHLHLGGAAPVPLACEIAFKRSEQVRKRFDNSIDLLKEFYLSPKRGSLSDYLDRYHIARDYLFTTLEDIEYVTYESCMNSFYNGSCLIELRTSIKSGDVGDPRSTHSMKDVKFTPEEEFEAIVKGVLKAEKAAGDNLRCYLIVSMRRGDTVDRCLKILEKTKEIRRHLLNRFNRDFIVGIDLAGKEFGNKAKELTSVFKSAKKYNLKLTTHAGEDHGSGPGSILHAIDHLGVDRIGHGTSLTMPTPLLKEKEIYKGKDGKIKNDFIRALQEGVAFEFCPFSNLICQAYYTAGFDRSKSGKFEPILKPLEKVNHYPFSVQMAFGNLVYPGYEEIVPLIATDACYPLAGITLAHELARVAYSFNLDVKTLMALTYFQIVHSFAPIKDKNYVLDNTWKPRARLIFDIPYSEDPTKAMYDHLTQARADFQDMLSDSLDFDVKALIPKIQQEVYQRDKYA